MQRAKPIDARQARLINYLHTQDFFFKLGEWPGYLRDMILQHHKSNRERFTLFFFLTGNGLDPSTAVSWTLIADYRGKEILGSYDIPARSQMMQLQKQLKDGNLFKGEKKMMDMNLGYVVNK